MRKIGFWLAVSLFVLLAGCLPQQDSEEEILQNDPEAEQETSIVPSHRLNEENYGIITPYEVSEARGVITNQVANRLDIDELEEGLRRHSKDVFDPETYYFQEGQYLTESMVFSLIDDLNPQIDDEDLDPEEEMEFHGENPRYLSHILEQNFLQRRDDDTVELAGISIGIAMKSVYRYQVDGMDDQEEISENEMLAQGEQIAQEILDYIREIEGLGNIPVMMTIYREAEQSSPIPGNFVVKTTVDGGSNSIGDWESLGEEYILFPSDEGREKYFDDHEVVSSFGNEIAQFFPNYVGIIGEGFYIDEELQRLSIEIPLEFHGKSEVIGFTQFAYSLVQEMFENYFELEIKATSSNEVESLIYRPVNADSPTVHIFH